MKIQSVKYLTREGFRNVWVNRLMSIASIGVLVACMLLIGMAILFTKNIDVAMSNLEQQNVVMAYFNDKNSVLYQGSATMTEQQQVDESEYLIHNEAEAKAVCEDLKKIENIASVEFVSSQEALERAKDTVLKDQVGAFEILEEDGGPMSHGARITLKSMDEFDQTVAKVKKTTGVHSVVSHGDLAKKIASIKSGIAMSCFWIIGILALIALVIVSNTIRVTMYNRKLEISIMKAVGATDSFVRFPFVIEGVVLGLVSAILSEGMLYLCYRVVKEALRDSLPLSIPFSQEAWLLLAIFCLIGVLAGALGSFIMIGKYLKKEGSEFKAL